MSSQKYVGIALLCGIMLTAGILKSCQRPAPSEVVRFAQDTLEVERLKLKTQHLQRTADAKFFGALLLLGSVCCALVLVASGLREAQIRRASVHLAKIGSAEIPVHHNDLHTLAPVLTGLTTAENLKAFQDGQAKAFALYCQMADVQTAQIKALVGRRGVATGPQDAGLPPALPAAPPVRIGDVPSFQMLVESGELAAGKPMILGYEAGQPRRGSFLDIYSSAIAGESGSGKTATLLYLIASGLLAENVDYWGMDPHYPHPKSLGSLTRPLWQAGRMHMATNYEAMRETLQHIAATIDARLRQADTQTRPVVLVVDELACLSRSSLGAELAHTMARIAMEGRKCAVYLLAASQTWLAYRTGGSSAVRDTLTSAFVHRMRPKQANLLLQDKAEVELVRKHLKHPGDALLCPVNADPAICKIPLITAADLTALVDRLPQLQVNIDRPVDQAGHGPLTLQNQGVDRPVNLVDQAWNYTRMPGQSLGQLAKTLGEDTGFLSKVLHGKKKMPDKMKRNLEHLLTNE